MDNQSSPYSAFFRLFGKENLEVKFNVLGGDSVEKFITDFETLLNELLQRGYTIDLAGLGEGEMIREADGWVLGKTSKGDLCVHLYKFPMKWKVATVYAEMLAKLPFKVPAGTQPIFSGAPERETAENNKILFRCPPFKFVMIPTGALNDEGKPKLKFDRLWGDEPSKNSSTKEVVTEDEEPNESLADQIESHPEAIKFLEGPILKYVQKAREMQNRKGTKVVDFATYSTLIDTLDEMYKVTGYAEVALSILSGIDTPELNDKLSSSLVDAVIKNLPTPATRDSMLYLMDLAQKVCD